MVLVLATEVFWCRLTSTHTVNLTVIDFLFYFFKQIWFLGEKLSKNGWKEMLPFHYWRSEFDCLFLKVLWHMWFVQFCCDFSLIYSLVLVLIFILQSLANLLVLVGAVLTINANPRHAGVSLDGAAWGCFPGMLTCNSRVKAAWKESILGLMTRPLRSRTTGNTLLTRTEFAN